MAPRQRNGERPWRPRAIGDLAIATLGAALATGPTWWFLGLPASYLGVSFAFWTVLALLLGLLGEATLPGPGLGPANRVTLFRAALVLPIAPLPGYPAALDSTALWVVIGLGTTAMVLDGLDGWVARRTGTATAFGARFDMELDAFLLLALSLVVWRAGLTGPWVVLIGGLRYLFVATGWIWTALQAPLPPSFRRKTVCVIQGVALLVCLGPIIPQMLVPGIAAGALAVLVYSFGVDVAWLAREG